MQGGWPRLEDGSYPCSPRIISPGHLDRRRFAGEHHSRLPAVCPARSKRISVAQSRRPKLSAPLAPLALRLSQSQWSHSPRSGWLHSPHSPFWEMSVNPCRRRLTATLNDASSEPSGPVTVCRRWWRSRKSWTIGSAVWSWPHSPEEGDTCWPSVDSAKERGTFRGHAGQDSGVVGGRSGGRQCPLLAGRVPDLLLGQFKFPWATFTINVSVRLPSAF